MRLVQWNIERGLQLAAIVEQLRRLDADVIALQEIDVGCERSGWVDAGDVPIESLLKPYSIVRSPSQ